MKQKILYIGVAAVLSLTACNDSFLERSPQSINDKTFWNTPSDLEAYVNNFYGWLPSGVTSIADGEVTIRCLTVSRSIFGDSLLHLHQKHLPGVTGVKGHGVRFA